MHFLCIVELHVNMNNIKILIVAKKHFSATLCRRQPKTYLGLCENCPIFLSDFKQIWIFLTDFHRCLQHDISRKSAQRESRWYIRRDGQTEGWTDRQTCRGKWRTHTLFSQIMRKRLKKRDKCGEFNSVIREKSKISFLHREDVSGKFSEILICFYQTTFNAV